MGINQVEKSPIFIALVTGIVAIICINNISRLLDVWNGFDLYVVAFVVFVFMGIALIRFSAPPHRKFRLIACTYAGIVVGVIIDVQLDFFLRHYDRNLFPFEIILWWIFSPIPILVGIMIGQQQKK